MKSSLENRVAKAQENKSQDNTTSNANPSFEPTPELPNSNRNFNN